MKESIPTSRIIMDALNSKLEQYARYEKSLRRQLDSICRREQYIAQRANK